MTLLDLGRIIRRYIVLVVAIPLVCLAASVAIVSMTANSDNGCTVNSRIIANSNLSLINGVVTEEARQVTIDNKDKGITATSKVSSDIMTVTITVSGPAGNEDLCTEIANRIADDAVAVAEYMYQENKEKQNAVDFKAQIEYANPDEKVTSKDNGKKIMLAAFLGGLFLAICIVVVIDLIRRPVKSVKNIEDVIELPVLEQLPVRDNGEKLLANIRFVSRKGDLSSVCVVPVKHDKLACEIVGLIGDAASEEGLQIQKISITDNHSPFDNTESLSGFVILQCKSLSNGMAAAYVARKADCVVIAVSQWSDSLKDLEETVAEFKLADANIAGIVYAPEVK